MYLGVIGDLSVSHLPRSFPLVRMVVCAVEVEVNTHARARPDSLVRFVSLILMSVWGIHVRTEVCVQRMKSIHTHVIVNLDFVVRSVMKYALVSELYFYCICLISGV